MKSIIVTGIGGVVGQGILRNIRNMALDLQIIGVNVERISAGNHLCDHVHEVPFAYDPGYVQAIQQVERDHDAGLILPSTDYEAYYLSLHRDELQSRVAVSPAQTVGFCLDKFVNFQRFEEAGVAFAASCLPSEYRGQFAKTVVKPREGRGSRNIYVDPPAPSGFDDTYVVQEYLDGPELTTTFYVKQDGSLHGFITLERHLEQGNTSRCEVVVEHDQELALLLDKMLRAFPFRGSCNIQSRVTPRGIVPFEINCRISGTNSVRSQFGFPDVAYAVRELLLGEPLPEPRITRGSALRVMMDVIYPGLSLADIRDRSDSFRIS
ncbi:ATP-grasp domain-containing protein [Dyella sp.]|jgi:carbamoyl-phosphate synthase large subunit|uniref:ATP-grasp domain-containing protein n=1 Tax=Dyella sp. TaxID=1869338 RepID=UPI002D76ADF7|nr:ATP-grasp domain-containing protein [Dyella sp.]HET6430804.1 ATP-grasp domain-containing protein [Dyella sp.]